MCTRVCECGVCVSVCVCEREKREGLPLGNTRVTDCLYYGDSKGNGGSKGKHKRTEHKTGWKPPRVNNQQVCFCSDLPRERERSLVSLSRDQVTADRSHAPRQVPLKLLAE